MNKIYSKVWNRKLGQLVVASELARSGGGKVGNGRAKAVALLAVLGGSLLMVGLAGAAPIATPIQAQNGTNTANASATGTDSTAAGAGATATAPSTTAIGAGSAAGNGANTAIGAGAMATGAMWGISGLGNRRTDGLGVNITTGTASVGGVAVGAGASAGAAGSTALGGYASASGLGGLAVGVYSNAIGRNSIAQGSAAYASGLQSTAMGSFSAATVDRATAVGTNSTASGVDSNAIGTSATASGARAIALGSAKNVTVDTDTRQNTIDNTQATGTDSIAIGTNSRATATNAISLGGSSSATAVNSVALGASSTTTANLAAAGYNPGSSTLAGTASAANGEVSVGAAGQERRVTNVAAGSAATDAVNVSQLESEAVKSARIGTSTAAALGGGATYAADGTISAPSYVVNKNTDGTGGTTVGNVGDAITNIDGRTTTNTTAINTHTTAITENTTAITQNATNITNLTQSLADGEVGLVKQDATSKLITVAADKDGTLMDISGNEGARTLEGVKAGVVNSSSLQAINGSQLHGVSQSMATSLGGGSVVNTDGTISAPSYVVNKNSDGTGGTTVGNVGDAITNIDGRTTTNTTAINSNTTAINTHTTAITENTTAITQNATNITNLTQSLADGEVGLVKQDATSKLVTVAADKDGTLMDISGNEGARTLEGVKAGVVNNSSLQAINGSQLHGASQSMATSLGGGSVVNADGTISAPSYVVDKNSDGTGGMAVGNVGDAITNIDGRTTTNTTAINTNTTAITNLDNRVTTVETNISNSLNSGAVGLVRQDATNNEITVAQGKAGTTVDFAGSEGVRTLTGVKAGGADADAVNVAQLKGAVAGLGGNASVNADGSITGPSYLVDKGADGTGGTTLHNVGDAITNIDSRTTTNTTAINNLSESLANGEIGLVQQDEDSRAITVANNRDGATVNFTGTAGARVLEGVAVGAVNASSLQAINGSQLHGVSQSIANNLGGGSVVNANGTISAPSYSVGGTTVVNVGDAIANLDGRTSANSSDIASLKGGMDSMGGNMAGITNQITDINTNVAGLDQRVTHLEGAITNGGFSDSGLVSANVESTSRKVASAVGSDALSVGNNSKAVGENSVALGNGSVADRKNSVSVGSQGNERQVANVAAGTQDTDAVNVAQLKQSVRYDQNADGSSNYSRVTMGQGAPVTMSNVAQGRVAADSSDAINGSQMYDWTMNRDNKFSNASLSHRVDEMERNMQAGVATALAARQAPYVPGKTTYAVGAAGYKSEGAVGISTRYTAGSGRWSLEGGFSRSGDGTGVYMGVSGVLGD